VREVEVLQPRQALDALVVLLLLVLDQHALQLVLAQVELHQAGQLVEPLQTAKHVVAQL